MSWAELKREAVGVERSLEGAVSKYVRVEVNGSDPELVSDAELTLEASVETLLRQLSESVEKMLSCAAPDRPATSRAQAQVVRESLFDLKTTFRRAQNRLKQQREGEALRKLMQRDLSGGQGEDSANALLMREHQSLERSSHMMNETIEKAVTAHSELVGQRNTFTGATGRLLDIGKKVPGINVLIKRIQDKRTRDNTVLALIIALCICFLLWYWLRGWGAV